MLEFGGEVAFEIVFDDEDVEEIGVAAGAEDIPRESDEAEGRDRGGMKKAEGVTPALGEERPEKNGAAGENEGGGAFGEYGEAEEETEQKEGEPRPSRKNRRIFVTRQTKHYSGAHHRDGQHGAEGHVRSGSMGEADHADGGRKQKEQPTSGFRAVETQREPSERKRGEQCGDGAGQPRGSFTHAKEHEAERRAPVEERRLFEPRLSVEAWGDPVAGFRHVARDPRIAWLVRSDEADGAEMAEIANVERCQNQNGPADAGGGAGACNLGSRCDCFGHGKLSLTSNHYLPATDLLHTVARRETRANLGRP